MKKDRKYFFKILLKILKEKNLVNYLDRTRYKTFHTYYDGNKPKTLVGTLFEILDMPNMYISTELNVQAFINIDVEYKKIVLDEIWFYQEKIIEKSFKDVLQYNYNIETLNIIKQYFYNRNKESLETTSSFNSYSFCLNYDVISSRGLTIEFNNNYLKNIKTLNIWN